MGKSISTYYILVLDDYGNPIGLATNPKGEILTWHTFSEEIEKYAEESLNLYQIIEVNDDKIRGTYD